MIAIRFLVAVTLKAALLLGFSALVVAVCRPSSAIRHLLRTSTLVIILCLPLIQLSLPSWETDWLPESWQVRLRASAEAESGSPATLIGSSVILERVYLPALPAFPVPDSGRSELPARPGMPPTVREASPAAEGDVLSGPWRSGALFLIEHWSLLVMLTWSGGMIYFLGRLLLSLACVRWAVYHAREVPPGRWRGKFDRIASRLGIERPVRLLVSERTEVALSVGILRPTVLIPKVARTWSDERLESILLHELAHVKRWDNLSNLVCESACAVYWYNPLTWWTASRLRVERERACDDQVLATGTRPSEYVGHLLEVARAVSSRRLWGHLEVSQSSVLKDRLMAALNPNLDRRLPDLQLKMVTLLVAAALLLPVATFRPWVESRDDFSAESAELVAWGRTPPESPDIAPSRDWQRTDPGTTKPATDAVRQGTADRSRNSGSPSRKSRPREEEVTGSARSFSPTRVLNVERGSRARQTNKEFRLAQDFVLNAVEQTPPSAIQANRGRLRFATLNPRISPGSLKDLLDDLDDLGPEPQPSFRAVVEKVVLGSLGEGVSRALAINDSGVIVGQSEVQSGIAHPFLWKKNIGIQDLGNPRGVHTRAVQINDQGQVLCETFDSNLIMGLVWSEETGLTELGSLDPNFPVTAPQAMNSAGHVAGSSRASDGSLHAFRWTPETGLQDLGIEGWSEALAINDAGQIVGHADGRAFVWDPDEGVQFLLDNSVPLSIATDLNAGGEIVGYAEFAPGIPQAFYWSPSTGWTNLGALNPDFPVSLALQINEQSHIVGQSLSLNAPGGQRLARGFRWTPEGGMEDIGAALVDAPLAINAVGHIIGTYGDIGQQPEPLALWLGVDEIALDGDVDSFRDSEVLAVNNQGQIVGSSLSTQSTRQVRRAVLWDVRLERDSPNTDQKQNQ